MHFNFCIHWWLITFLYLVFTVNCCRIWTDFFFSLCKLIFPCEEKKNLGSSTSSSCKSRWFKFSGPFLGRRTSWSLSVAIPLLFNIKHKNNLRRLQHWTYSSWKREDIVHPPVKPEKLIAWRHNMLFGI